MSTEKYELIEILGIPALFSNGRIKDADVPSWFYKYDLREGDSENPFATVEKSVVVNHAGTILTLVPIEFGNEDYIELDEDTSPNFTGESYTLVDFAKIVKECEAKMLSSICNHCTKLGSECKGIKNDSTYTGCAQKESFFTFYGETLLKEFKDRCINVIGRDYFKKVCESDIGTAVLNEVVTSDELLAGCFLFDFESMPQELLGNLEEWSCGDKASPISVMLYYEGAATEVDSYTTPYRNLLRLLKKAIRHEEKYDVIEVLGTKALYTEERLSKAPDGFYKYELREGANDPDTFYYESIEWYVDDMFDGTVLTLEPIDLGPDGVIYFDERSEDDKPGFDGTEMTIEEFRKEFAVC